MNGPQDTSDAPTKCVQQTLNLNIKAQIQFIDFEGRSDGESVMKLIQQVYTVLNMTLQATSKFIGFSAKIAIFQKKIVAFDVFFVNTYE